MAKGRKPKPTSIKKLHGTARKDRILGDEFTPKSLSEIPLPPTDQYNFDDTSIQLYYRLAMTLHQNNILTPVDIELLLVYVNEMQIYREQWEAIKTEGQIIIDDKGNSKMNPRIRIANMMAKNIAKIASEFGFTPSSRTRIGTGQPKGDDSNDPFKDL